MPTGHIAGVSPTVMRMHRLDHAYNLGDIHHELRVVIEELSEDIAGDLEKIRLTYDEVEATIAIDFDQYGLSRMVYERAIALKEFFAAYRAKVRFSEDIAPLDDEVAIHCVHLAYKLQLCVLENEPNLDDTIYFAWRGHLELS